MVYLKMVKMKNSICMYFAILKKMTEALHNCSSHDVACLQQGPEQKDGVREAALGTVTGIAAIPVLCHLHLLP